MNAVLSILFDGVAYAMLLFIISVGLSITMGLMGFVNLAHGAFAMAGGYVVVSAMNVFGLPFLAALLAAFIVVGAASVVLERLLYAPLYRASELDQTLLSIGIVFMSMALVTFAYGPNPPSIQLPEWLRGQLDLGVRTVPTYRAFIIGAGLVFVAVIWLIFERTLLGARIRAAVDNRTMAQSVGINVDRLFMATFAFGSGMAALGGGLAIEVIGVSPSFAISYLVFFLIIVAVGGLGSLRGAFVAALLLGIVDTAGKYLWPQSGAFIIYVVTLAVLLVRPDGLFGKSSR
ncbi:MAG: branched-chain amino acid transport system permease protein [Gammaproteobacteria bacterium]